jgi:hypothetical protein
VSFVPLCEILPLILALFLLSVSSGFAAIVFERSTVEIPSDPSLTQWVAEYPFKNTGKKPVTITQVRTCCGCTTSKLDKKTFAANESGKLSLIFKIEGKIGFQQKHAVIITNDGAPPSVVYMKGNIETAYDYFTLSTQSVRWEKGESRKQKTILISAKTGSPYRIISTHILDQNIDPVRSQNIKFETQDASMDASIEHKKSQVKSKKDSLLQSPIIGESLFLLKNMPDVLGCIKLNIIPPRSSQSVASVLEIKTDFSNGSASLLVVNLGAF